LSVSAALLEQVGAVGALNIDCNTKHGTEREQSSDPTTLKDIVYTIEYRAPGATTKNTS
jgi:hypothetical protein